MTAGPGRFGQPELPDRPPPAGLFTRGYDRAGTDELVAELTARLQERTARLYTVERENRRLRAERAAEAHSARVAEVEDSISILASAQENADQTVAEADAYREQAAAEVERLRAEARREAEAIMADARAQSRALAERSAAEAADRERRARQQQEELRRQTDHLRAVRDAAGTQMLSFLDGLVDHVAAEFGLADPAAMTPDGPTPLVRSRTPRPAPALPAGLTLPGPGPTAAAPTRRGGALVAGHRPRRRRQPREHVRHLAGR